MADDGLNEVNATTDVQVTSVSSFSQLSGLSTRGSIVESNLNGSFEVLKSGSDSGVTFVVIEKQRDINFKSDEGSLNGILELWVLATLPMQIFTVLEVIMAHQTQIPVAQFLLLEQFLLQTAVLVTKTIPRK